MGLFNLFSKPVPNPAVVADAQMQKAIDALNKAIKAVSESGATFNTLKLDQSGLTIEYSRDVTTLTAKFTGLKMKAKDDKQNNQQVTK